MHDDFANLFTYNRWADARVTAACRSLSQEDYTRELPGGMTPVRSKLQRGDAMDPINVSAQFAAYTWYMSTKDDSKPSQEQAVRFAHESSSAFRASQFRSTFADVSAFTSPNT